MTGRPQCVDGTNPQSKGNVTPAERGRDTDIASQRDSRRLGTRVAHLL